MAGSMMPSISSKKPLRAATPASPWSNVFYVVALVMLAILARAPESSMDPKFGAAMLFFAGGAIAAPTAADKGHLNRVVLRSVAGARHRKRRGKRSPCQGASREFQKITAGGRGIGGLEA